MLERLTPLKAEAEEPAVDEAPESTRGRGVAREPARKPRAVEGRAAKRTNGHTIYLHDDLFERIMVQAHRKKKTISDYVAAILERQVPDYRSARPDPGESDAA